MEKVVPLAACVDIEGTCLWYARRLEDVLIDSPRLLVDTGLDKVDRSLRACSIAEKSAFFWIVERETAPRLFSDVREAGRIGIGGAVPGIW